MIFTAYGHENVKASHKTTLEFTKEDFLTPRGDCILGINADYHGPFDFMGKIKITITVGDITDEVIAEFNPSFDSDEMVIRKSEYVDKRTFAINADKAAFEINRQIINKMRDTHTQMIVEIQEIS